MLGKRLTEYVRSPPPCKRCGSIRYREDHYRAKHEVGAASRKNVCYPGRGGCSEYHFPHVRGRGFCHFNNKLSTEQRRLRDPNEE